MTRSEAFKLVNKLTKNKNLVKHMLAVEAQMRVLAKHFGEDEELWGLVGLVHDADYEMYKDEPKKHPSKIFEELEKRKVDPKVISAVKAHAWGWRDDLPEPKTKMEWALYTCDDLSGMIVACALVRPDKKLSSVKVDSVIKKWNVKSFAAGVDRKQVELCEEKLGIKLREFISICLSALQGISGELGL
jgi:putative nucleotidyltransferase with HDIG domain